MARPLLALACLLAAATPALGAPAGAEDTDGVIVKLASGGFSIQEAAAADARGELGEAIGEDLRRYKLQGNETVQQVAQRLAAVPGVEYAVPDRRIWTEALKAEGDEGGVGGGPDDGVPRSYPESKGFKLQWGSTRIGMPAAWAIAEGAESKADGVTVCIVDSGVDAKHRNLAPNLAPGIGYNAVDGENKSNPADGVGHGTEVAGVIAGAGKANGAVGVNQKNINLLACKFMSADGWGKTSDAIQCLDACVRADAAIISASWTSGQFDNPPLDEAVGRVQRAGVLMVVSAGNQGVDMRRAKFYPQSYATKYSNMLVVGSTDEYDDHCWFSNHDPRTVHISAPGNMIYTTAPGGGHTYVSGTSISAPFVTGAAALVLAAAHDRLGSTLTALQVKQLLMDSSELLPALAGKTASGGRLRVDWALQALMGLRRSRRTPCLQRPGTKSGKCKTEMAKRKRMEEKASKASGGGKATVAGKSLSLDGAAAAASADAAKKEDDRFHQHDSQGQLVPAAQGQQPPADPLAQTPTVQEPREQRRGEEAPGQPAPAPAPAPAAQPSVPAAAPVPAEQPAVPAATAAAPAELAPLPAELAARVAAIEAAIAERRQKAAGMPALEAGEHEHDGGVAEQHVQEEQREERQHRSLREWLERQAWETPGKQQKEQEGVPAHPGRRMQGLPAFRVRAR